MELPSPDFERAQKIAEGGDAAAQVKLGDYYYHGDLVKKNYRKAMQWYRKAADQSNAKAEFSLGLCYHNGHGEKADVPEALKWYRKAAEHGNTEAQWKLAEAYRHGTGTAKDEAEAVRWYKKAAEAGHDRAQCTLGYQIEHGQGIAKDMAEAIEWYRKAGDAGNATAQLNLALCYDNGRGVLVDAAAAFAWFQKAAERGNVRAQHRLGLAYEQGRGVAKDTALALQWYRKAADNDSGESWNRIGRLYDYGEGVPQDQAEAVRCYKLAADYGHAPAAAAVGLAYETGQAVGKDLPQAARWYRKGAENGDAKAQMKLASFYEQGKGLKQDMVEALRWYHKAADKGSEEAIVRLHELGQLPEHLKPSLAAAQQHVASLAPPAAAPASRAPGKEKEKEKEKNSSAAKSTKQANAGSAASSSSSSSSSSASVPSSAPLPIGTSNGTPNNATQAAPSTSSSPPSAASASPPRAATPVANGTGKGSKDRSAPSPASPPPPSQAQQLPAPANLHEYFSLVQAHTSPAVYSELLRLLGDLGSLKITVEAAALHMAELLKDQPDLVQHFVRLAHAPSSGSDPVAAALLNVPGSPPFSQALPPVTSSLFSSSPGAVLGSSPPSSIPATAPMLVDPASSIRAYYDMVRDAVTPQVYARFCDVFTDVLNDIAANASFDPTAALRRAATALAGLFPDKPRLVDEFFRLINCQAPTESARAAFPRMAALLRCPVCENDMIPPIFQCFDGHVLCEACHSRSAACPTCKVDFSVTPAVRNVAIETLAQSLMATCPHPTCHLPLPLYAVTPHEAVCPHRPWACPEDWRAANGWLGYWPGLDRTCSFTAPNPASLLAHFRSKHAKERGLLPEERTPAADGSPRLFVRCDLLPREQLLSETWLLRPALVAGRLVYVAFVQSPDGSVRVYAVKLSEENFGETYTASLRRDSPEDAILLSATLPLPSSRTAPPAHLLPPEWELSRKMIARLSGGSGHLLIEFDFHFASPAAPPKSL